MSLLQLPEIRCDHRLATQFDVRPDALERWHPEVRAAKEDEASISIYDSIGENWEGTGITAKRISGVLRNIGTQPVKVNVNSPGGDFFEGVAIYNLLRNHKAKVTVQIMGLAASAASVIAMAGDEILMGEGAWFMVHNAWTVSMGNRHDLRDSADRLEPFDQAMAEVYSRRTGLTVEAAAALMDKETWIGANQAVTDGFATGLLERADILQDAQAQGNRKVLALVEASMARAGHSRSTRRDALRTLLSGMPSAAGNPAMPSAGDIDAAASLQTLLSTLSI
jgi:ATP-dependent Clp protease protease subunit